MEEERFGLLVDPGSWGNFQGSDWLVRAAKVKQQEEARAAEARQTPRSGRSGPWHAAVHMGVHPARGPPKERRLLHREQLLGPHHRGQRLPRATGLAVAHPASCHLDCSRKMLYFVGEGDVHLELPAG
eukprot:13820045-Heterocapsa_arctica.AAC.1